GQARRLPVPGPVSGPAPAARRGVPNARHRRVRPGAGEAAHRRGRYPVHREEGSTVTDLSRPIGIGFAARGNVSDVIDWAERARRSGLDSVWIHDSYFEREAVTYASAIASHVEGI